MDLNRATALVSADVRESYPDMTDAEAIEHARDTVDPESVQEDDELADAYRLVLAPEFDTTGGIDADSLFERTQDASN